MATLAPHDGTQRNCKGWGSGQPILFSQGWPLSATCVTHIDPMNADLLAFIQGRTRR